MENFQQKAVEERLIARKVLAFTLAERDRLNAHCRKRHDQANRLVREIVSAYLDRVEARANSKKKKA